MYELKFSKDNYCGGCPYADSLEYDPSQKITVHNESVGEPPKEYTMQEWYGLSFFRSQAIGQENLQPFVEQCPGSVQGEFEIDDLGGDPGFYTKCGAQILAVEAGKMTEGDLTTPFTYIED